jgi:two-component system chemotaxis response regulator CheB
VAQIVVVGTSWGGIDALQVVLSGLPARFSLPVVVVHHLGGTAGALSSVLRRHSALPVEEANDKERLLPGTVFLAPAGYHLLVEPGSLALSIEGPVHHARPSIDVLFETAAEAYGKEVISVILTGASRDGARGAAAVKRRGGVVVVQDPAEAASKTLPEAAIAATPVDHVLPLAAIPPLLARLDQSAAR